MAQVARNGLLKLAGRTGWCARRHEPLGRVDPRGVDADAVTELPREAVGRVLGGLRCAATGQAAVVHTGLRLAQVAWDLLLQLALGAGRGGGRHERAAWRLDAWGVDADAVTALTREAVGWVLVGLSGAAIRQAAVVRWALRLAQVAGDVLVALSCGARRGRRWQRGLCAAASAVGGWVAAHRLAALGMAGGLARSGLSVGLAPGGGALSLATGGAS